MALLGKLTLRWPLSFPTQPLASISEKLIEPSFLLQSPCTIEVPGTNETDEQVYENPETARSAGAVTSIRVESKDKCIVVVNIVLDLEEAEILDLGWCSMAK